MSDSSIGIPVDDSAGAGGAVSPVPSHSVEAHPAHSRHELIVQFIKFCTVGFSSLGISMAVEYGLIGGLNFEKRLHVWLAGNPGLQAAATHYQWHVQIAAFIAFLFGVTNGFYWNSRWTFPQANPAKRKVQCVRFFIVNVIGLFINQCVLAAMLNLVLPPRPPGVKVPWQLHVANIAAVIFTSFWNFGANRLWTFKD